MLKDIKKASWKNILGITAIIVPIAVFLFFMFDGIIKAHVINKNIFSYTVKVRDSVEEIDKILERAEVNLNAMKDSIASNYDISKQNDKQYNYNYIKQTDSLTQSILQGATGVDGVWFQLNSNLPFSSSAYNWYEFKDNQFINLRDEFESDASTAGRKITPEDDPYYFGALGNLDATWSELYTDPDTNNQMITLSQPIYKSGSLIGVAGIDISVENLEQALQKIQLILTNSEIYLLNNKNKIIVTLGKNYKPIEMDQEFLEKVSNTNQDGLLEYKIKHSKKIAVILTLSNKYKIILAFDDKIIYGNVNQLIAIIYVLLVLFILSFIINVIPLHNESNKVAEENKSEGEGEGGGKGENESESDNSSS